MTDTSATYRCSLRYLFKGMRAYWRQESSAIASQPKRRSFKLLAPLAAILVLGPIVGLIGPGLVNGLGYVPSSMLWAFGALLIAGVALIPFWLLFRFISWLKYCCRLGWELEQGIKFC